MKHLKAITELKAFMTVMSKTIVISKADLANRKVRFLEEKKAHKRRKAIYAREKEAIQRISALVQEREEEVRSLARSVEELEKQSSGATERVLWTVEGDPMESLAHAKRVLKERGLDDEQN